MDQSDSEGESCGKKRKAKKSTAKDKKKAKKGSTDEDEDSQEDEESEEDEESKSDEKACIHAYIIHACILSYRKQASTVVNQNPAIGWQRFITIKVGVNICTCMHVSNCVFIYGFYLTPGQKEKE